MDLIAALFRLSFALGAPIALLTWYLFSRLYDRGQLDVLEDPKASFKALKERTRKEGNTDENIVQRRWMKFGGGYYGLTALWTLVVIEVVDFIQFVVGFPGFAALFADGVIAFIIGVLINQLKNIIAAFIWFGYWDDVLVCIAVSYIGYLLGMTAAQRGYRFNRKTLRVDHPTQSEDTNFE